MNLYNVGQIVIVCAPSGPDRIGWIREVEWRSFPTCSDGCCSETKWFYNVWFALNDEESFEEAEIALQPSVH